MTADTNDNGKKKQDDDHLDLESMIPDGDRETGDAGDGDASADTEFSLAAFLGEDDADDEEDAAPEKEIDDSGDYADILSQFGDGDSPDDGDDDIAIEIDDTSVEDIAGFAAAEIGGDDTETGDGEPRDMTGESIDDEGGDYASLLQELGGDDDAGKSTAEPGTGETEPDADTAEIDVTADVSLDLDEDFHVEMDGDMAAAAESDEGIDVTEDVRLEDEFAGPEKMETAGETDSAAASAESDDGVPDLDFLSGPDEQDTETGGAGETKAGEINFEELAGGGDDSDDMDDMLAGLGLGEETAPAPVEDQKEEKDDFLGLDNTDGGGGSGTEVAFEGVTMDFDTHARKTILAELLRAQGKEDEAAALYRELRDNGGLTTWVKRQTEAL